MQMKEARSKFKTSREGKRLNYSANKCRKENSKEPNEATSERTNKKLFLKYDSWLLTRRK